MWSRRDSREGKVVLSALASAGDDGMTPLTLAVVTNLPERRLGATLSRLIRAGLVNRHTDPKPVVTRIGRSRYRLAGAAHGR